MKIIGITGGTGAGKTSALRVLGGMGAEIIDCDELYHELLESDKSLLSELEARFPGVVVSGRLERKKLGELVFADSAALEELSAITHRYVSAEVDRRIARAASQGKRLAAIDAIALIESGLSAKCGVVFGVTAPEDTRVCRIMLREGISEDYARKRVRAQKPESFYRENCDVILENGFDTEAGFSAYCRDKFRYLEEE